LALIRGRWFLICTCDIPAPECYDPEDWLGVDLGIHNLAADSDGEAFSGAEIQLARRVFAHRDDAHPGFGQCLHLGRGHLADRARGLEEGQNDGALLPGVGDGFAGRRVG
jgi:hypothetical protein